MRARALLSSRLFAANGGNGAFSGIPQGACPALPKSFQLPAKDLR